MEFAPCTFEFSRDLVGGWWSTLYTDALCLSAGAVDRVFPQCRMPCEAGQGRKEACWFQGAHRLCPRTGVATGGFWCVRPLNRRRMAALGADGRAQPWCLTAQFFLRCLGRTTDVKKAVIYAGPSMRGIGRNVPGQCRNARYL